MHVQRSSICCSLCLPPKFTSRTVHSRRHAAALSSRRLRFACTPGQEWARQNLDLYESCWLSLTGYSQSYFPEWLTMAGEYEFQLRTPTVSTPYNRSPTLL